MYTNDKNAPKSQKGGAYIMVLAATMMILVLVSIALTVTAVSRRVTARYAYYIGLTDLAVAGNEQALFLLRQAAMPGKNTAHERAFMRLIYDPLNLPVFESYSYGFRLNAATSERFHSFFTQEIMRDVHGRLGDVFQSRGNEYRLTWGLNTTIEISQPSNIHTSTQTNAHTNTSQAYDSSVSSQRIQDTYRAFTTITPYSNFFTTSTNVRKYVNNIPSFPTVVEASIIWTPDGHRQIIVDEHTIYILEYVGAIFPIFGDTILTIGTIIFLDEFALAMIESLRVDITGRRDQWER